jgi:hypothetical protein
MCYGQRPEASRPAGVREVVVFHSSDDELLPYQGRFPFDVIGDPEKLLHRRYGLHQTALFARCGTELMHTTSGPSTGCSR